MDEFEQQEVEGKFRQKRAPAPPVTKTSGLGKQDDMEELGYREMMHDKFRKRPAPPTPVHRKLGLI